jgi:hypothetical protein
MSYKTKFQGIVVESNVPLELENPSGSVYEFTIKFNQPLPKLISNYYSHVDKWAREFIAEMTKRGHKVSDLKVSVLDDYTLYVSFRLLSPALPLAVILPWVLRLATIGTIGGIIWGITATVTSPTAAAPLAEIKNIVLYLVLGLFGIIGGVILFKLIPSRSKEERKKRKKS